MRSRGLRNSDRRRPAKAIAALLVLLALAGGGCRPQARLPPTYPVRGKVVFPGGRAVHGGGVHFQSQADAAISASGDIGDDGTFVLSSFVAGVRAPGAVPGEHRVIITPPLDMSQHATFPVTIIARPVTVAPGENEFTLTVAKQ